MDGGRRGGGEGVCVGMVGEAETEWLKEREWGGGVRARRGEGGMSHVDQVTESTNDLAFVQVIISGLGSLRIKLE